MNFDYSPRTTELLDRLESFMDEHIYPNEARYFRESMELGPWAVWPVVEELKPLAREAGLWNLFLPDSELGAGLDQPRVRAAVRGDGPVAPRARGVQLLGARHREHGGARPLRHARAAGALVAAAAGGQIRSAFAMTEPAVASSDATNIESSIVRDGDEYVINGRKWYTTNATDPRCKILIFMGKSDPQPRPPPPAVDDPGSHGHARSHVVRPLPVFNFYGMPDRASEVEFADVRVPVDQHPARGGPRLRDRPGPPRSGPHPPLHAPRSASPNGRWR